MKRKQELVIITGVLHASTDNKKHECESLQIALERRVVPKALEKTR
jgi:hypothetical protein